MQCTEWCERPRYSALIVVVGLTTTLHSNRHTYISGLFVVCFGRWWKNDCRILMINNAWGRECAASCLWFTMPHQKKFEWQQCCDVKWWWLMMARLMTMMAIVNDSNGDCWWWQWQLLMTAMVFVDDSNGDCWQLQWWLLTKVMAIVDERNGNCWATMAIAIVNNSNGNSWWQQ